MLKISHSIVRGDGMIFSNTKRCPMCDGKVKISNVLFIKSVGTRRLCVCKSCGYHYHTVERLAEEMKIER